MLTPLEVKKEILDISGLPGEPSGLKDGTKLSELGYNANMIKNLENKLGLAPGSLTGNSKVSDVITSATKPQE